MCAGVVPQQPPTTVAPASRMGAIARAKSSGPTSNTVLPSSTRGNPALGWAMSRPRAKGAASAARGANSSGPSEQLRPTAAAPSADSVDAAIAGVVPRKVRPSSPKLMVANTGSAVCSTAASTAAFASSRSVMVSTTMRSQPAASAARACSAKMS